ncbi:DNA cytosine methyltransferase [Desulfovibrio oxamicus]|uniref:DNA (cytosine-5-)-methyltransferase n=1 Tax=Nitratidesulfovibrio oxamicus TaxID=32016 RepID=A0ABS0IZJ5_9BACT|nr:DNA cytosine methyltransferase [Nitratidesulfovibrio oxamicus]MBG3875556.1 DNA cytosine methyltransferase [Nitratidesulfovibrio oxamicus]
MRASLQDLLGYSSDEIVVDLFAGGGGASLGIEMAGFKVDAAVNHNPMAVAIHRANHPHTEHFTQDVFSVSPRWITRGRRVGLLWASPDCTDHSKAKGGVPIRNAKRRELARVITDKWIPDLKPSGCHPRVIWMENVEEFQDWGPLDSKGCIISTMRGASFKKFCRDLRRHGYRVEFRELRASHFGVPTIRKRLYLCARRDGMPIVWPQPTHGDPKSSDVQSGRLKPWRTAAEIIDWSVPCPSIFDTSEEIMAKHGLRARRPLKENTLRRVAKGIQRYVIDAADPFVVDLSHTKSDGSYDCFRGCGPNDPLPTITQSPGMAVCAPVMVTNTSGHAPSAADAPVPTITTGGQQMVCAPFLQHVQHASAPCGVMPADEPMRTITAQPKGGSMALVATHIQRQFGNSVGHACDSPVHTIMPGGDGKTQLCAAILKHYGGVVGHDARQPLGTVTTTDHNSVVTACIVGAGGPAYGGKPAPVDVPLGSVLTENHRAVAICKMRGENVGHPADEPLHTVSAGGTHHAVSSCLLTYYGTDQDTRIEEPLPTVVTRDRFALVQAFLSEYAPGDILPYVRIDSVIYVITDIGLRMLTPRELARAQGFPDSYIIDFVDGKRVKKEDQVAMIGNSVCPGMAAALVAANYVPQRVSAPEVSMPLLEAMA